MVRITAAFTLKWRSKRAQQLSNDCCDYCLTLHASLSLSFLPAFLSSLLSSLSFSLVKVFTEFQKSTSSTSKIHLFLDLYKENRGKEQSPGNSLLSFEFDMQNNKFVQNGLCFTVSHLYQPAIKRLSICSHCFLKLHFPLPRPWPGAVDF